MDDATPGGCRLASVLAPVLHEAAKRKKPPKRPKKKPKQKRRPKPKPRAAKRPKTKKKARATRASASSPKPLRLYLRTPAGARVRDASSAVRLLKKKLDEDNARHQEVFVELVTDVRGRILGGGAFEIARGQIAGVRIGINDVLYPVLQKRGSAFFVLHNHPSGDPEPSPHDRALTGRIERAVKPFEPDVVFLGQVAVGKKRYWYSVDDKTHEVA